MKKIVLILVILLIAPCAKADDFVCTATPACAAMGYDKTEAECTNGGVRCPFDKTKFFCIKGGNSFFSIRNKVNNLDIVYSDGTTSATMDNTKIPIGVAVVTETNNANNHGIILSIKQEVANTWAKAVQGCAEHITSGTSENDWSLPNLYDIMEINGWDTDEGGVATSQYADLRAKMKLILNADQLGWSAKYSYGESGSADNGGSYLRSIYPSNYYSYAVTCSQCTADIICSFNASETFWSGGPSYRTISCNGIDASEWWGSKSTGQTATCTGNSMTCSSTLAITSDYYWTASENVSTPTNTYYMQFGVATGNRILSTSKGSLKSLYRCIMRF